ncbi:hypothetical protein F4777DRAFT_384725 [Nemania sp. FL0916]|nr:hypothetical protein F4777DRAFT_384725 [Nemania sp. FL0916]
MDESIRSILCRHSWNEASGWECWIIFSEDGGGRLMYRNQITLFIVAQIQWRVLSDASLLDKPITGDQAEDIGTPLEIEITLTRDSPHWIGDRSKNNEHQLNDEAFLPKTYTVRLETGEFSPCGLRGVLVPESAPKHKFRLVFDKSPLPSREEWKRPTRAAAKFKPWEWTEFIGATRS